METKIEIEHVFKSFGGNMILKDITLEVSSGEIVALIGPSGAGKSTLLRCINDLETIDYGRIAVDGEMIGFREEGDYLIPLGDKAGSRRRANTGMVFQQFNLFQHMTALKNVTFAPRRVRGIAKARAEQRAAELLAQMGLAGKEDSFPAQLSGGQQQRVAIARALAMEPTVLLLDEPTSALDPELQQEVADVIRDLSAQSFTMMLATHDMSLVRDIADRIVFMVDGEIVEQGPAVEVLQNPQHDRTRSFFARLSGTAS